MAEKYAVRNLRLCTKDCLCLYVCPTGATDTENSIIDPEKCIGCGAWPKPVHPLQSLWFQKNCRRSSRKNKKLSKHFVA